MPNDAKLGLVVGMSLVIAVAVMFFRKDTPPATPVPEEVSVPGIKPAETNLQAPLGGAYRPVHASAMSLTKPAEGSFSFLRHTVSEGETLFTLAHRYYGDGDKFVEIYRANRDVLKTPDQLPLGTVLIIPLQDP